MVRTDLPWRTQNAAEDRLSSPQTHGPEDVCLCVDGRAAGVVDTSCHVDITAVQFSLLRGMWGLFPLALTGIVFFSSPPPPAAVK